MRSLTHRITIVLLGAVTWAGSAAAQQPSGYDIIWFDSVGFSVPRQPLFDTGVTKIVLYTAGFDNPGDPSDHALMTDYLDEAQVNGVGVILSVKSNVEAGNFDAVEAFVDAYKGHAAVTGWYISDEPALVGAPGENLQAGYDLIKQKDNRPVYIAFAREDLDANTPVDYRNAYDVGMFDYYPFQTDEPEFEDLEDETIFDIIVTERGWMSWTDEARQQSIQAGRPIQSIVPAFGEIPTTDWDYRLPTYDEMRFVTFYSLYSQRGQDAHRASVFWAYHRLARTTANASAPYPHDGIQWQDDVLAPVMQELQTLADALAQPEIDGAVNGDADVPALVYQDPMTGVYYLIALNTEDRNNARNFVLDLPDEIVQAIRLTGDTTPIEVTGNAFSDDFGRFDVRTYRLVSMPEPSTLGVMGVAGWLVMLRRREGGRARSGTKPRTRCSC